MKQKLDLSDKNNWKGLWTAIVTPFLKTDKSYSIDKDSLKKLIEYQIESGVDGLVLAGSTGEGSLLGKDRYRELLKMGLEIAAKRIPIIAGLGIGGTESALELGMIAKECGVQGLLAAPPAYIKAPQRELVKHFLEIAKLGLPVCLYEIPGRAAQSIALSTLEEITKSSLPHAANIVAIKDASGDMIRGLETAKRFSNRLACLSGDDCTYVSYLAMGGNGVVSVVSHLVPKAMKKIEKLFQQGKNQEAFEIQKTIQPLIDACFYESNPIPVKTLVSDLGLCREPVFLPPLGPMDKEKHLLAKNLMTTIRERVEN
jgi:4-hydroxy-tetrahydrodipicolinate synthase